MDLGRWTLDVGLCVVTFCPERDLYGRGLERMHIVAMLVLAVALLFLVSLLKCPLPGCRDE